MEGDGEAQEEGERGLSVAGMGDLLGAVGHAYEVAAWTQCHMGLSMGSPLLSPGLSLSTERIPYMADPAAVMDSLTHAVWVMQSQLTVLATHVEHAAAELFYGVRLW